MNTCSRHPSNGGRLWEGQIRSFFAKKGENCPFFGALETFPRPNWMLYKILGAERSINMLPKNIT